MFTIAEWLEQNVTADKRALEWLDGPECEDRIRRGFRELLSGYDVDPAKVLKATCFVQGHHSGLVQIRSLHFYSICAHHFLPFFGTVDITYIPGSQVIGLGKFPRLVEAYSRRFQIQEHLVRDIAEKIVASGGARAATSTSKARHLCMCSRGPSAHTAETETTWIAGDTDALLNHLRFK